jgi:CRP/FNR family transcriptional regulator, anaerobic regulatory protein
MDQMTAVRAGRERPGVESVSCRLCSLGGLCAPWGRAATGRIPRQIPIRRRELEAGDHLVDAGKVLRNVIVLRSGSARAYLLDAEGHEQTCSVFLPGETIGLEALNAGQQQAYVVALEPVSCCELPLPLLREMMMRSTEVRDATLALMGTELSERTQRSVRFGHGTARARLAAFLLDLHQRRSRRGLAEGEFRLSMDRRHIASLLGLSMETVSRAMSGLKRDGLVDVNCKRARVLRPESLMQEANRCPSH